MSESYEPPSLFLRALVADEIPLGGSDFGDENLARLIEFLNDNDRANRDWAALLLSETEFDTVEIRTALRQAAEDADADVSAEAIRGLAARDPHGALPLVERALSADSVLLPIFEAAESIADPLLIPVLEPFSHPSDDPWLDAVVHSAIAACQRGGDKAEQP